MSIELIRGVVAQVYLFGVVYVFLRECFKNRKLPQEQKDTSGAVILKSAGWPMMLAAHIAIIPFLLADALYVKIAGKE
jgi:hypothetical protein